MPTTRKKVIKTVYKDDNSDEEEDGLDFVDSGSEAEISDEPSSSEDEVGGEISDVSDTSSVGEFKQKPGSKSRPGTSKSSSCKPRQAPVPKKPLALTLLGQMKNNFKAEMGRKSDDEQESEKCTFSIKDLTESDKLLPSVLNLSESDSSGDDEPSTSKRDESQSFTFLGKNDSDDEQETSVEYKDVWSKNLLKDSDEIAKKTFEDLERHKLKVEATKASIQQYSGNQSTKTEAKMELDVKDLLAQGEDVISNVKPKKLKKKKTVDDSESDVEDWEEVNEAKGIPQQGLQLVVGFPEGCSRKSKKLDVEMMMKRRINRVKKEYQVYMHKVHLLCWLGHGNYVSKVLNDQDVMVAALKLIPSKDCFPGAQIDLKFVEQITTWYKNKLTLKQDKNENKFKTKAPPLKEILISEINSKVSSTKKYLVFIFVALLRSMGVQCRVMFNFVTLPMKPPSSELCSLSTKPKDDKKPDSDASKKINENKKAKSKKANIKQLDGHYDISTDTSDSDCDLNDIMQLDGNDDTLTTKKRSTRATKKVVENCPEEDVSPPKIARLSLSKGKATTKAKIEVKDTNKPTSKPDNAVVNQESLLKKASPRKTRSASKGSDKMDSTPPDVKIEDSKNALKKRTVKEKNTTKSADVVPNPRSKRGQNKTKESINKSDNNVNDTTTARVSSELDKELMVTKSNANKTSTRQKRLLSNNDKDVEKVSPKPTSKTRQEKTKQSKTDVVQSNSNTTAIKITVTDDSGLERVSSEFFNDQNKGKKLSLSRKRSHTANESKTSTEPHKTEENSKVRTKSAPGTDVERSKYFKDAKGSLSPKKSVTPKQEPVTKAKDNQRVSHRDIVAKSKAKSSNLVTGDLVDIIKNRVKEAKAADKNKLVKGKAKKDSGEDSDYLPEEAAPKRRSSDDDFKPTKLVSKRSITKKIDRRVLSSDDETPKNKIDVWCEVYVEELEQWVAVDVIKAQVHCAAELYGRATHPVNYTVGWDNNNFLKDVTRRYVPHWHTVTRKQRVDHSWWTEALKPWLGLRTARDKEEDDQLDRMQLDAPLPKSIAEYKHHPLYALQRHLLKFEALYPPDAATLGFVRGEGVYSRECVYTCRSRDTWLKEAKVVRLGEKPYKVVKARPKWDKLSNKAITDRPLEVFGPWQVQDYEPPTAENGIVPRNAYGNVELFKTCMLPKKTVHMKLPGLNKVAKKLNIDCAPAMTGFDYNGGYSHPVYDGFVVCEEFEDVLAEAWTLEQEELERKENEKLEARVYGNWKRLIKGLFIRERLKSKYGFKEPEVVPEKKKAKAPRFVVKK